MAVQKALKKKIKKTSKLQQNQVRLIAVLKQNVSKYKPVVLKEF